MIFFTGFRACAQFCFRRPANAATSLSVMLAALVPMCAIAQDPNADPRVPFLYSSDLQVTMVQSLEKKGKPPVILSVEKLGLHGNEGYDLNKTLRPDLFPYGPPEDGDRNLLFGNGEVKEENAKDKSWVKYKCAKSDFVDWLSYVYSGAYFWVGIGQIALQNPAGFIVTDGSDSTTYVMKQTGPRADGLRDPDAENFYKSVTLSKKPPIRLIEVLVNAKPLGPGDTLLSIKFSYGPPNSPDANSLKPPSFIKEIANPLQSREVYP
jgi:hypothetical protein